MFVRTRQFANLPRQILSQKLLCATSCGISTAVSGSRSSKQGSRKTFRQCTPSLSRKLRPDKPISQALQLKAPLSMTDPAGTAALRRSDPAGFDSCLSQRLCPDDDNGARVLHGVGTPAAPPRNQARDPRRRRKHPAQRTSLGRILVHSDHAEGVSAGIQCRLVAHL